jgi:hypothetical protein
VLDGQRRTLSSLTPEERQLLATSAGLPPASVEWIARVLPLQQALVVPFNTVMVSVEPCNMACVPTGTATQAKGATYYQTKYSGKDRCAVATILCRSCDAAHWLDSNPLAATASVLHMAKKHIDSRPSTAEDAQTDPVMRKARHLLQHTVNSLHSTMEISDQQVKCARELHHTAKCSRQLI